MAKGETYEEFVAKFKKNAPKTTDDCYTPQPVYEVVKAYALKLAGLTEETCTPVRPFYPGGDYRNYDYPADAYVIDNPPFSILSEIRRWYIAHGIKYFLFAPSLTSIGYNIDDTVVLVHEDVIFDNGAYLKISFVTNAAPSEYRLITAPELKQRIKSIVNSTKPVKTNFQKYRYPRNTFTTRNITLAAEVPFNILRDESRTSNKIGKTKTYGNFYILSDHAADNLDNAIAAALKAREEKETITPPYQQLELSPEQLEIVSELNRKNQ